jgi:hypothetical protein
VVYAIKFLNYIKIGVSAHPANRVLNLTTCVPEPLTVIGVITGERNREQAIHRRFAHLRLRGEWFRATPELEHYLQTCRGAKLRKPVCVPEPWAAGRNGPVYGMGSKLLALHHIFGTARGESKRRLRRLEKNGYFK